MDRQRYLEHIRALGVKEVLLRVALPIAYRVLENGRWAMVHLEAGDAVPEGYTRHEMELDLLVRPGHPRPFTFLSEPVGDVMTCHLLRTARVLSTVPDDATALTAALWPPLSGESSPVE